jgi:hypothetical protein
MAGAAKLDEATRRLVFDAVVVRALADVVSLADSVGATIAPVKGVVLARWLYGDLTQRPYRDLDVLVARPDLPSMMDAVAARGWPIRHQSLEMGELEFSIGRVTVEVHAEFSRRDFSRLTTDEVLSRAVPDRETFSFEIRHIDDIDHFLLLIANVNRKAFVYANRHQPADLERLLARLEPRWPELVSRVEAARFETAVRVAATWMIEEHGSSAFARFAPLLIGRKRPLLHAAIRQYRRRAARHSYQLARPSGLLGLALAVLTPDDRVLQLRGITRVVRRGISRWLGRQPG